ncbi:protein-glutamate O-methyltransferase CheR, partial [candidate division WOR-3 bacterium]|nr:protein-glutamate O-methyltransferase CheR [candidate division WOR-3 bacterium]
MVMATTVDKESKSGSGRETGIDPLNYRFLQDYVYRESGIVLDGDKQYLLDARLMPIVHQRQLGSLNDLCALLRATGDLSLKQEVVEAMTTNETFFFRDLPQYEALRDIVLPRLVEERQGLRKLSFWSAAASTGQEAYSLAILLLEMGLGDWNIQILGTDLSTQALERARAGKYLQIEVNRGLPARYLVKHFTRSGLEWQLKDEVRRMVRFESFDLRKSMRALGPFDIVFCKNVLIYFDIETKKKILREIRGTLFSGGYLLLGGSETALALDDA